MSNIEPNSLVFHKLYGQCTVRFVDSETAIIRTPEGELAECRISDLSVIRTVWDDKNGFSSLRTLLRIQSGVISSINNTWGLFSRTVIKLLPHQLWVCNRVMRKWPARMLIADDVGLGKTIEAGMILLSAIKSGRADRILIITPASLTYQWQQRMSELFGLSFDVYQTHGTDKRSNQFSKKQLIASISSLKIDKNGRHDELLASDKWDLVIVDEAHHAGVSPRGVTLGYNLIHKMEEAGKIDSLLFFTATPHQGMENSFWKLMELLDNDAFSGDKTNSEKYGLLPEFMIRNNKSMVTDMNGNKLFKKINQHPSEYEYTEKEAFFYQKMTEYIENGFAYAASLDEKMGGQIILVLIALQKIASSSIAAIRNALKNRLKALENGELEKRKQVMHFDEFSPEDVQSETQAKRALMLMANEKIYIKELISLASEIKEESRILRIMELIEESYSDESILFFTEYKATQALMIEALRSKYGYESVSFINGGESLIVNGARENVCREDAMKRFNTGKVKYLVSTEASGEGVDLQQKCHVLIHVDLPWNPMRLHQRIGRIYRLGQDKDVDVVSLRNPKTIEGMIWEKLDTKLDVINKTFGYVMDNPEDMKMLVLGIQSPSAYERMFSEGTRLHPDSVDKWFDKETMKFGNKSAYETIQAIEGNAARFDLSCLNEIPKFQLGMLKSFFEKAVEVNGKKPRYNEYGNMTFSVPDEWLPARGKGICLARFAKIDYSFSREFGKVKQLCAVGDALFDAALSQARSFEDNFALIDGKSDYIVFRIYERITTERGISSYTFVGYKLTDGITETVKEIELFELLEEALKKNYPKTECFRNRFEIVSEEKAEELRKKSINDYRRLGVEYSCPESEIYALLAARKKERGLA